MAMPKKSKSKLKSKKNISSDVCTEPRECKFVKDEYIVQIVMIPGESIDLEILIINANLHTKYFARVPEEDLDQSPLLIFGICELFADESDESDEVVVQMVPQKGAINLSVCYSTDSTVVCTMLVGQVSIGESSVEVGPAAWQNRNQNWNQNRNKNKKKKRMIIMAGIIIMITLMIIVKIKHDNDQNQKKRK